MKLCFPTFHNEILLRNQGYDIVLGIDEVGRGAFAGPLVAAGVAFAPKQRLPRTIHDSKLLTRTTREQLFPKIKQHALWYTITEVSTKQINTEGIGKSICFAFEQIITQAIKRFCGKKIGFLIDGYLPRHFLQKDKNLCKAIIKGDQKSISIAAASIIAKVYRDSLMKTIHKTFPFYHFDRNKGYGTRSHQESLKIYGLSKFHRSSFDLKKFLV